MRKNLIFKVSIYLFVFGLAISAQGNVTYQVFYNQGEKNTYLNAKNTEGFDFVSIQDFADCLDARTYYSDKTKKAILYWGSQEIKVAALNPFVVVDNRVYQMPTETRFLNAEIYVPLEYFLNVLIESAAYTIEFNKNERFIKIFNIVSGFDITAMTIDQKSNGILVHLQATKKFSKDDLRVRIRNNWLYLDIYQGKIDSGALSKIRPEGVIKKIIPEQVSENIAQISFRITGSIIEAKPILSAESNNIMLSIRTEDKLSEKVLVNLEKDRQRWQIDKIAIDPGHGGKDPGAIGPSGLYEKDVVLNIAKQLKKLLTSRLDVEVFMTREDDRFIPLRQRTAMANQVGAKLFISIHANSNRNRKVQGVSTYILGHAKSEEAAEVARLENSVIQLEVSQEYYSELDNEQFILSSIAQSEFTRESEELAAILQNEISHKTSLRNRGVKQAGYYVLWGASMPNFLLETAFISNLREEKLLKSSQFQTQVAESIFESIRKFKEKYEQSATALGQQ